MGASTVQVPYLRFGTTGSLESITQGKEKKTSATPKTSELTDDVHPFDPGSYEGVSIARSGLDPIEIERTEREDRSQRGTYPRHNSWD